VQRKANVLEDKLLLVVIAGLLPTFSKTPKIASYNPTDFCPRLEADNCDCIAIFNVEDYSFASMDNIPPGILESLRNKQTAIFIGSGFSLAAGYPSATAMAALLSRKLRADEKYVDPAFDRQLDKAAELFETTYGRAPLIATVESFFKIASYEDVSPSHRLLASLVKHGFVKTIITTNYDSLIEDACALLGTSINVIAHESQLHAAAGDTPTLYKIHGDFAHPDLLVLTPFDMQGWEKRRGTNPIVAQIRALMDRSAFLFLGYSLSDFNILTVLLGSTFSTQDAPRHKRFAAVYSKDEFDDASERLSKYGIKAFHCDDLDSLLRNALLKLPVGLNIEHLVFNYPSWYPDQQAQYGGIETFIEYLQNNAEGYIHHKLQVYRQQMLMVMPGQRAYSSYPAYPGSFFFFRAVAKAAMEQIGLQRRLGNSTMPDVIHIHFLPFAPLCEDAGVAALCTSHSLLSRDLAYAKGLFDEIANEGGKHEVRAAAEAEQNAASSARFVTVLSLSHEQEVRNIGARSIHRLDAPFDPNRFHTGEDPASARQRASLTEAFTITYVGRPDRRKGIETLIAGCERLAEKAANLQLVFVGHGFQYRGGSLAFGSGYYRFDTSMLERLGVTIALRQAYNSTQGSVYYLASDIVAVPSLYEPMGYVVLEAMACGRPIVASRIGGIVDFITHERNGVLVTPGNAEEMGNALIDLYNDPEKRARLGIQARQDVEKRRPLAEVIGDWQELYRRAAFAFGESLYPDLEVTRQIRTKCEEKIATITSHDGRPVDSYGAAVIGCEVAKETIAQNPQKCSLPSGVPVDRALFRAIAMELRKALRLKAVPISFSASALSDVMVDLSLAELNRDQDRGGAFLVTATSTKEHMRDDWFERAIKD
jgi:glycosyltransferase involved in cell wall biosynthesis